MAVLTAQQERVIISSACLMSVLPHRSISTARLAARLTMMQKAQLSINSIMPLVSTFLLTDIVEMVTGIFSVQMVQGLTLTICHITSSSGLMLVITI